MPRFSSDEPVESISNAVRICVLDENKVPFPEQTIGNTSNISVKNGETYSIEIANNSSIPLLVKLSIRPFRYAPTEGVIIREREVYRLESLYDRTSHQEEKLTFSESLFEYFSIDIWAIPRDKYMIDGKKRDGVLYAKCPFEDPTTMMIKPR